MTLATLSGVTLTETTILPVDFVDGRLYGRDVGTQQGLYESDDYGENWTLINTLPMASIYGVRKLADGEVLVNCRNNGLWKSSGWSSDRTTATWAQVLTPTTDAWMLPWGWDVSGAVVIATEYAVPREPSKCVWVSTDNGDTFTEVLNLDTLYPGQEAAVHWHAVGIDPWANNRLWVSNGDGPSVVRYSDDLGETWTALAAAAQPTSLTAGRYGMVGGSDEEPEGLYRVLRRAPLLFEGMATMTYSGWYGYAMRGWRDPDTDLVFVAFQASTSGFPAHIMVGDGKRGHSLYETASTSTPNFTTVMTHGGVLIAHLIEGGTNYLLRGTLTT